MIAHRKFPPVILALVVLSTLFSAACDPLGNAAQVAGLVPTRIPTLTPLVPAVTLATLPPRTPDATDRATNSSPGVVTATDQPIGEFTPTPFCIDQHGQVVDASFKSKITGGTVAYRVYLPPCYWQTNRRYPYVILLHGSDGDQTEWTDKLHVDQALDQGIASGTLPPMIVIMPNGGSLQDTNVFTDGASFESLVLNELTPVIEQNFCTWNAREGRAIGGISRGGFWAYEIGFRHTMFFSAIGGHSAFFDPANAPPAYNPLNLAQSVKFSPGLQPRLWLDAGRDDYARPNIEVFAQTLSTRHIDPGYTMYPIGEHVVSYWVTHVSDYLAFYGQTWPHDPSALPSCLL
ncbi:MAG: alpha/beta hydrolase [Aggregatilineales bacterium]